MTIRKIDSTEKSIVNDIVSIHLKTFTGFFLTFMGRGFLKLMYRSYTEYQDSGILVAFEGDMPVGFLAYSGNLSGLYKYMIKKRLVPFAGYSAGAFFRKPKIFMRLLRAFLKPSESKRDEKYVELASIGVLPESKSHGVGTQLIQCLVANINPEQYTYISLETDAEKNDAVNQFYQRNGFVLTRNYVTAEGRKMNEYRRFTS